MPSIPLAGDILIVPLLSSLAWAFLPSTKPSPVPTSNAIIAVAPQAISNVLLIVILRDLVWGFTAGVITGVSSTGRGFSGWLVSFSIVVLYDAFA